MANVAGGHLLAGLEGVEDVADEVGVYSGAIDRFPGYSGAVTLRRQFSLCQFKEVRCGPPRLEYPWRIPLRRDGSFKTTEG